MHEVAPLERTGRSEARVALVTGANSGIGKEVARQLASSGDYRKIYLACRNAARAEVAKKDLEQFTGKPDFRNQHHGSVRRGVGPGGVGVAGRSDRRPGHERRRPGRKAPMALTRDGVTTVFATNVLGHVVLLEGLIQAGQLRGAAVFAGSEAARGIPDLWNPTYQDNALEAVHRFTGSPGPNGRP